MNKETNYYIDVDRVIQAYNDNNPDKPKMTRQRLAEMLGIGVQIFSDWKSTTKKTPRWARTMLILLEVGNIPVGEFIRERKI